MRRRGAADGLVGNADVGDLRGHADHERGIRKVPVIGVIVLVPAWKLQASGFGAAVIVMDLCSRRIVGWVMDDHPRADLPSVALKMAISAQWPGAGLIHNSDRGVQYACENFRKVLQLAGFKASMSHKGDCYDNAPMESFFHQNRVRPSPALCNTGRSQTSKASIIEPVVTPLSATSARSRWS